MKLSIKNKNRKCRYCRISYQYCQIKQPYKNICRICYGKKQSRKWYKKNRKSEIDKSNKWRRDNLERVRKRMNEWRKIKREQLAGKTKPDYCEACGLSGRICFDHCHKTGKFRGWICNNCNTILGHAHDDIKVLQKLINYLKKCV